MQPLVKTVYVFRNEEVDGKKIPATTCPAANENEQGMPLEFSAVDTADSPDAGGHWVYTEGEWKFVREKATTPAKAPLAPEVKAAEPVVKAPVAPKAPATKPAPVAVVKTSPATLPATAPSSEPAKSVATTGEGWEETLAKIPGQRVIAIPLDKLTMGDPRYNIVIQDGDTIWVPPPVQGEFYLMGNVLKPGVYSLTGRDITIRQAISAAGGLAPLADPTRAELIRRIGGNQEQILAINVDRIFSGKEPDIILKSDDVVNVGSNPLMPFLAVLRNAFRATYGFGFVYDRNFADIDSFNAKENPETVRRLQLQELGL
jgi:hypothetical protein